MKVAATIITARPSFSHRFDIISTLAMQMDKVKQFSCSWCGNIILLFKSSANTPNWVISILILFIKDVFIFGGCPEPLVIICHLSATPSSVVVRYVPWWTTQIIILSLISSTNYPQHQREVCWILLDFPQKTPPKKYHHKSPLLRLKLTTYNLLYHLVTRRGHFQTSKF